jgi:hypothetical protein
MRVPDELSKYVAKYYNSINREKIQEGFIKIVIVTDYNRPAFFIDIGEWQDILAFREDRGWAEDIFLKLIYDWSGNQAKIGIQKEEKLYPPDITLQIPREKIGVINSFRYLKAEDRSTILKFFRAKMWTELEQEIVSRGIAGAFKKK